jgi:exoribonuclease-2
VLGSWHCCPSLIPKAEVPLAAASFHPGDLVGIVTDKGQQLALLVSLQGSKAQLLPGWQSGASRPRPLSLPLRQVELIARLPDGSSPPEAPGLAPWRFTAEQLQAATPPRADLAAAWLLLAEDDTSLSLDDWLGLQLSQPQPVQLAAAWLWLQGDQLLFRWRQQQVSARPLPELRRLRLEQRRQRLVLEHQRLWHEQLKQRQPLNLELLSPAQRQELNLLLTWASGDAEQPLPAELRRGLQVAGCAADTGAIRHLLVDLGLWDLHCLPSLRDTRWELGFNAELEAECQRLLQAHGQPQPGDELRSDLSHQHLVTIDDVDTRDIDDGLALEQPDEGPLRLWIHVADPGRLVAPGDPLDLEARRRASSLYLSRGSLPMFPLKLATGPFSLVAGQRCPAWSIWVELAADGAIAASGVLRSWVKPAYRLSYDDADELIDLAPPEERQIGQIHQLLLSRRQWRLARGALQFDQPEGRIREIAGEPTLEITEPSPSRLMVAEAMILAGAVVAELGQAQGLALPYRSQLPAELPPAAELAALPEGPVRHAAIRRCLSRGYSGTSPSPHFSLALDSYVQATSPIRRYGDLLVQRQLAALLYGGIPLDADQMQQLLNELESPQRQVVQISREDQRHWQQVWFERHRGEQWQGQFLRWLRPQDGLGLVHAPELAMDLAADCPSGSQPGDELLLRVQLVDPLRDQLRMRASG